MRKTEEDQGTRLVRAMTNILLGGVVALAVCLMFLFLCSIGISGGWLQEGLMYQMAVVSCVIGGAALRLPGPDRGPGGRSGVLPAAAHRGRPAV